MKAAWRLLERRLSACASPPERQAFILRKSPKHLVFWRKWCDFSFFLFKKVFVLEKTYLYSLTDVFDYFEFFCSSLIFSCCCHPSDASQAKGSERKHSLHPLLLLRNMRAGSDSQAGKAVVDSSLDLAGLGYFYFLESHGGGREERWKGDEFVCLCLCVWGDGKGGGGGGLNLSTNVRQWPVTARATHANAPPHQHSWRRLACRPERHLSLSVWLGGRSDVVHDGTEGGGREERSGCGGLHNYSDNSWE